MKKILMYTVCLLLFFYGNVFAGKWIRTGTLDQGYFVVCVIYGEFPTYCAVTYSDGSVEYTQEEVDNLNAFSEISPDIKQQWYHWDNGYLIKYKMPWRYIEGVEM